MRLKVARCLPSLVPLLLLFVRLPINAQPVPCAAITRNPLVLEALLDYHSQDADSDIQDDVINAAQLERLEFSPIAVQPGDAIYIRYRGRDFTIDADFASGARTTFDSPPAGSFEQWRKGILALDMFRSVLNQKLIHLRAVAKSPNQVLFRDIRIIRAGKPIFEFASLASYGKVRARTAVQRQLPCVGFDDEPANGRPRAANYSLLNPEPVRNFSGGLAQPMLPPFPMALMQSTPPANSGLNHYKFNGKELDDETGLYNYGARYYSSSLGRYITPDWSQKPTAVPYADLSNPQTLNLYTYSHNNPTSFADQDGHDPGDKFKSKVAAAVDAVKYIRNKSDGYSVEYGTRIQKNGKIYTYQEPVTQHNPKGVDLPPLQKNSVGDVHTHENNDPLANSIQQPDKVGTITDKDAVQKMQDEPKSKVDYQSYVGAPNGDVIQFTPNPNAPDGLGDTKVVQHNVAPNPPSKSQPQPQPQHKPKTEKDK